MALNLRSVAGHATSAPPGDQQQIGVRRDNWKYVLRGERGQLINLDDSLSNSLDRASEEPGLRNLAGDIKSRFSSVEVAFHKEVIPWVTL